MRELRASLESLAERWELPAGAGARLEGLLGVLAEDPGAPTSVADPAAALDVHVADSLSGLGVEGLRGAGDIADIGSGAGFPGVVLAIALPETQVDLIESAARKCAFLERLVGVLELANARVVGARAEQWASAEGAERYSAAVARALAPLATVAEYAAPLLRIGGVLVAWKGRRDAGEERRGAEAATALGLQPTGVQEVQPFTGSRDHHLHSFEKVAPTPSGYPRRPGMARKRPLGRRAG